MNGMVLDRIDPNIAAILVAGVLALVYVLVLLVAMRRLRMRKRITALSQRWQSHAADTEIPSIRRAIPEISPLLRKMLPNQDSLRMRLSQSGRSITVGQYVLGSILVGILTAALMAVVLGYSVPVSVLGACVAGFALPHLFVSHLCRRRQRAFTSQICG